MNDLTHLLRTPEVNYDSEDIVKRLGGVALALDERGIAGLTYAAFMTRHEFLIVDSILWTDDVITGPPLEGITPALNSHTLWMRQYASNGHGGPWLAHQSEHVPPYLAEKFDVNLVDAYGIAVAILLVEVQREGGVGIPTAEEKIKHWKERTEESIPRAFDLPKFMGGEGTSA